MKNKLTILLIILLFCIPIILYNIGQTYFERKRTYEINWEINLPFYLKDIYSINGPRGFQGDGVRYSIYESNESDSIIEFMNTIENSNKIHIQVGNANTERNDFIEKFVHRVIEEIDIPKTYQPSFEYHYMWKYVTKYNGDSLVILYYPNTNRLYFIEEIM